METSSKKSSSNGGRTQEVARQIELMAYSMAPDTKLPGVRELHQMFAVSTATLHHALNLLEEREVLYRRQGSGIYVSAQREVLQVAMLSDYAVQRSMTPSPFWSIFADSSALRAQKQREELQVFSTSVFDRPHEPVPPTLRRLMDEGRVQGILAVAVHEITADWLRERAVPFVSLGALGHGTVSVDRTALVRSGVRALAERGCQRIGLWEGVTPFFPVSAAMSPYRQVVIDAFEAELTCCQLTFDPSLVELNLDLLDNEASITRQIITEQAFNTACRVFSGKKSHWPDGVVITDDVFTHGALTALFNSGIEVGRQLQLATHANVGSSLLLGHDHRLILLEVNPVQIVETMFDMLETLMRGGTLSPSHVFIAPQVRHPQAYHANFQPS